MLRILSVAIALVVGGVGAEAHDKLSGAQSSFFNARYDAAAAVALEIRESDPEDLAAIELRAAALLFKLKATLGDRPDKGKAFKQCLECADLLPQFLSETTRGQAVARAKLREAPRDESALFFLGKLNLNYVWLQLGPLGKKTGWDEYWEARHSRVARAWIDYVVDAKMPWGTRWILGGGSRKRALASMQAAAAADADFFVNAEARFSLWDLYVRERQMDRAIAVAQELERDFPDNAELAKFLSKKDDTDPR
jgi:hypothetical protein